jgi:hypothetical protein
MPVHARERDKRHHIAEDTEGHDFLQVSYAIVAVGEG